MEKRAIAPLFLGAAGLAVAVAIGVLLVKVRSGAPAVPVSADDQARAASRAPSRAADTVPSPPPRRPEPDRTEPAADEPSPEKAASIAEQMIEANRLYDRGEYEAAGRAADVVLSQQPGNVKMLRIAASSACILGDAAAARVHYDKLPSSDQEQIARRCRRYGVEF